MGSHRCVAAPRLGRCPHRPAPALAEISFTYDTTTGAVTRSVAQRPSDLYLATLGLALGRARRPTKTALVSPTTCPDQFDRHGHQRHRRCRWGLSGWSGASGP